MNQEYFINYRYRKAFFGHQFTCPKFSVPFPWEIIETTFLLVFISRSPMLLGASWAIPHTCTLTSSIHSMDKHSENGERNTVLINNFLERKIKRTLRSGGVSVPTQQYRPSIAAHSGLKSGNLSQMVLLLQGERVSIAAMKLLPKQLEDKSVSILQP